MLFVTLARINIFSFYHEIVATSCRLTNNAHDRLPFWTVRLNQTTVQTTRSKVGNLMSRSVSDKLFAIIQQNSLIQTNKIFVIISNTSAATL